MLELCIIGVGVETETLLADDLSIVEHVDYYNGVLGDGDGKCRLWPGRNQGTWEQWSRSPGGWWGSLGQGRWLMVENNILGGFVFVCFFFREWSIIVSWF